ncbi:MAG TPA: SIMPL domain-containing protein [Leptolyngbyaceae cyanobacterium]
MSKILPKVYHSLLATTIVIGFGINSLKSNSAPIPHFLSPNNIYTRNFSGAAEKIALRLSQARESITPALSLERRAIAVIGQGQATAPADTALLEFRFASRAPIEPPQPNATANTSLPGEELLKPVVDSLLAIKVPNENIEIQTSSLENPKLLVKIDKPTRERVQEVVKVANSALQASDSLFMQGIGAEYAVNDCQRLEKVARSAALKDAESQVTSIASEMGVQLGELLLVTVYPIVSPASVSACGSKVAVPVSPLFSSGEGAPPYNPSAIPQVKVQSQISVTYGIK